VVVTAAVVRIGPWALLAVLATAAVSLFATAGAGAAETVTQRFTSNGAEQTFVVPAGITTISVRAVGGTGRGGGAPAEVTGSVAVSPGRTLYVEVGGSATGQFGGFNGGGQGGNAAAGGGGGASDVRTVSRTSASGTLASRLIVAGASGGASSTGNQGGAAGAEGLPLEEGGKPGTQTEGGESEELWECWIEKDHEGKHEGGTFGELGIGGEGEGCRSKSHGSVGGGGGGAGLYGGGGGGVEFVAEPIYEFGSGGGGGSSLVPEGGTSALAQGAPGAVEIAYVRHVPPPVVSTGPASGVGIAGATLNATVDPQGSNVSSCRFEYGTSISYENSVPCSALPGAGTGPVDVSATIGDLAAATTYHYRILATSAEGSSTGADGEFTTKSYEPPVVSTEPASGVGPYAATLNATVDPQGSNVGSCRFEYGTSAFYENAVPCSASPGAGTGPVAVSAAVEGLAAATTYHYRIVATNQGGTRTGADAEFTTARHPTPGVAELSPTAGPIAGGTTVTLTGTELDHVTAVTFGGVAATAMERVSNATLRVVTPPGTAGDVAVRLEDDQGDEAAAGTFAFVSQPEIVKLGPAKKGPTSGGTEVQIAGSGLAYAREVLFGGTPATFRIDESGSTIYAAAPAHAAGKYVVTVVSPGGQSSAAKTSMFQYIGLELTSVSPSTGPRAGGAGVTVTGAGFAPGQGTTAFVFGKAAATNVACASTTECTMTVPAAAKAGTVDLRASIVGGKGRSRKSPADRYTYE
jgi:hypothetical protein